MPIRVEELESKSVCKVSELTRMERTDQASERNTNQHLLIASGVPRERLICGGRGEKKDRRTER